MPPSDANSPAPQDNEQPSEAPRRRIVFPWVWLIVLLALRLALQAADVTSDFKALATIAAVFFGVVGVCLWYAIRGRGPVVLRLLVAAAPFAGVYGMSSLYEFEHNGSGAIVGLHRRGDSKQHEKIESLETATPAEGLTDWAPGDYDYPRFLGSGPWAEANGPALAANWETNPPQELWRRPIGAGWSAFAVYGPYAITQEQRGGEELVVCYRAETGEPVWSHSDPAQYTTANFAGEMGRLGPRATPTIVGDRVYTQGAGGLINCFNALNGEVIWRVDSTEAFGVVVPIWGKSGSPLFIASENEADPDLIVVNIGAPLESTEGAHDASIVAFDAESGEVVWKTGWRQTSYSSPQLVTLADKKVILQTSDEVLTGHDARTGEQLLEHPWSGTSDNSPSCSQPLQVGQDLLLLTKGYGHGASLLKVASQDGGLSAEPLWSPAIRPVLQTKYSNAVVRDGHAYGLNGEVLQCVNIESGKVVWKKRRRPSFGYGQLMLTGGYLLVMSEQGEVILADASHEGRYKERGSLQALDENEICWNNPVLCGDLLLVRNAAEAAAYRLPLAETGEAVAAR